jgi:hypothetical protein
MPTIHEIPLIPFEKMVVTKFNSILKTSIDDPNNIYTSGNVLYSSDSFVLTNNTLKSTNQGINNSICVLQTYLKSNGFLNFEYKHESENNWDYFVFVITDKTVVPDYTRTTSGTNSLYYFKISGAVAQTSVSIDLNAYSAVEDLRVDFVYFKDGSVHKYTDTLTLYNIIATDLPIYTIKIVTDIIGLPTGIMKVVDKLIPGQNGTSSTHRSIKTIQSMGGLIIN